jgi:ferredoxin
MEASSANPDHPPLRFPKPLLQVLLDRLRADGFQVVGPTVDQEAIVYGEIRTVDDLPRGWTDEQEAGRYRLVRRDDDAWFGFVVGPQSWKKYLFPPSSTLATADRTEGGWTFRAVEEQPPKYAFLGVRACELAAIAVQDRVFAGGPYVDPIYAGRRRAAFVVAVNCTQAASTCFCTSMGTGPRCRQGFDLALTELPDAFVAEIGTQAGADLLAGLGDLGAVACDESALASADQARQQAVDQIAKRMDATGLRELLFANLDHPRWAETAQRCLSCTNCTMVCPTCFCSSVEEVADLREEHVERKRSWDSCFDVDFDRMHGGSVRRDVRARYRQWLTHKLAGWHDQFGTSGCVGCGRCITWCPVGIDLTEEVAAIRETTEPQ